MYKVNVFDNVSTVIKRAADSPKILETESKKEFVIPLIALGIIILNIVHINLRNLFSFGALLFF